MNRRLVFGIVGGVLLIAGAWLWMLWNRPPAVAFDNLRYVQLLRTAVSARNSDWLSKVQLAITQRHEQGGMSNSERKHFERIIQQARSGDWQAADQACFEFEVAQMNRRRANPVKSSDGQHSHSHRHESASSNLRPESLVGGTLRTRG